MSTIRLASHSASARTDNRPISAARSASGRVRTSSSSRALASPRALRAISEARVAQYVVMIVTTVSLTDGSDCDRIVIGQR